MGQSIPRPIANIPGALFHMRDILLKGSGSLLFAKRGKPYSLDGAIDTLVDFNSIEIVKKYHKE